MTAIFRAEETSAVIDGRGQVFVLQEPNVAAALPGPPGAAATVTVGATTTGAPGSSASVTNSGTSSAAVLDFTIPRGPQGPAATIAVGTVTTGAPGSAATVTNVGTSGAAEFNFSIPRGADGSGTVTSVAASGGSTGLTFLGGPITGSGTLTLDGELNLANIARGADGMFLVGRITETGATGRVGVATSRFANTVALRGTSGTLLVGEPTQPEHAATRFYVTSNFQALSGKNVANGYAGLGADGKINGSQLPALAITETFPVSSQAAMLALTAQVGDVAIRTDSSQSFILRAEPASTLANWTQLLTPAGGVTSVAASGGSTGFGFTGGPITSTGTLTLTVDDAPTAREALGVTALLDQKISNGIFTAGQQLLISTSAGSPSRTDTVPANSLVGRAASGGIKGLTTAEATSALGVSGNIVGTGGAQTLTGKTLTAPIIDGYTEGTATASGTAFAPSLAEDTIFFYTTTGNATITLPTPVPGKSFIVVVQYGGTHTLTWAGGTIRWAGGTAPTPTSVNGKRDTFAFVCVDGTSWQNGGMNA